MSIESYNDQFYVPGWFNDKEAVAIGLSELDNPYAEDTEACQISIAEVPKKYYPWQIFKQVMGYDPIVYNQGQVGSCVGFGTTSAAETTIINEIFRGNKEIEFFHICQEITYGGSRFEVNNNRVPFRGDGSNGIWAAKFIKLWGILKRGIHGKYDLSKYTESNARLFGSRGVPDELEPTVKESPVGEYVLVRTWEDAVKLMAQGYGISVCSNYGFGNKNDKGVASKRGVWNHCMELWGYDLTLEFDKDELGLLRNSWSPQAHPGAPGAGNPPKGTFWARANDLDGMLRQGDSFAFSKAGFKRVKPLELDYSEVS